MRSICMLIVISGVIMLCCLSACAPASGPMKEPPVKETIVEKPLFLGDKHNAAGVECESCHQEDPPAKAVATDICLGCHEEYSPSDKKEDSDFKDPHDSHIVYSECGSCHKAHKASRDQCSSCHSDLDFNIP